MLEVNEFGAMHRYILNVDKECGKVVDHINGNHLDNRKCNLRVCTQQQNIMNSKPLYKNNTSKHKGVSFRKDTKKWRAYIKVNYKQIVLGSFDTVEEAIAVRKQAEEYYFGDYARK